MLRLLRGPVESERTSLVAHRVNSLPAIQETWVQFLGQEDPLEKVTTTHCSIFAWRIPHPWTEEPCGLYSLWGHRDSDTTERLTLLVFQESEIDVLCLLFLWRRKSFCLIYTSWVRIKGRSGFTFLSQKPDWQECLFSFLSDLFHYLSDWDLVNWRGLEVLRA